ncbi:MAG TPA: type II secretion system F family protein, partial [Pirellulales bacterium]|nr:type II secretion system F family protein [Pirellulales bacterium]
MFALSDLFNYEDLLPLAVFGLFALVAWFVLDFLATRKPRAVERLDEIKNPGLRRKRQNLDEDSVSKKSDAVTRVLAKASPALAKPLQPKNELELNKLKMRLANAGFRGEAASSIFLGLKFSGLVVGMFLSGVTVLAIGEYTQKTIFSGILFAGGLFYLPELVLAFMSSSRKQGIFLGLPDALDLMVVCVEAGLGLDQAMRKVSDEMRKTYKVISEEFSLANFQLQMGRPRAEVLHELGIRSGVDDLRSLASILIQADKFGSS